MSDEPKKQAISDEIAKNILATMSRRFRAMEVQYRSGAFYKAQAEYIAGVWSALDELGYTIPFGWLLIVQSRRELVSNYNKQEEIETNG